MRKDADPIETSPRLTVPTHPVVVNYLRDRLTQYREHISAYNEQHHNQHPHQREMTEADAICKATIVERLFRDGEVVAWDLQRELVNKQAGNGEANALAFAVAWPNAWAVIEDYCLTGGAGVISSELLH